MAQAKAAAGDEDVVVQGAHTAQRALDELLICPRPGAVRGWSSAVRRAASRIGSEIVRVIDTPEVTHIRYRVRRPGVAA